jgi:uncharacterized protein
VRHDVEFVSEGGALRGWLFVPEGDGPHPGVVATAGFADVKESLLWHGYPQVFCGEGLAVLLYDHPNFGDSEGEPRQEVDPLKQRRAYRDAITFLATRPEIDADRIGIWGTSYSGGQVFAVAAADRRVKCVVSQVPGVGRRSSRPGEDELQRRFAEDRVARMRGEPPAMVRAFADDSQTVRVHAARDAEYSKNWRNEITLRSRELVDESPPGLFMELIDRAALLLIVAADDSMAPAADVIAAFERAPEPKRVVVVPGEHYAVYEECFDQASQAARDWFLEHL